MYNTSNTSHDRSINYTDPAWILQYAEDQQRFWMCLASLASQVVAAAFWPSVLRLSISRPYARQKGCALVIPIQTKITRKHTGKSKSEQQGSNSRTLPPWDWGCGVPLSRDRLRASAIATPTGRNTAAAAPLGQSLAHRLRASSNDSRGAKGQVTRSS